MCKKANDKFPEQLWPRDFKKVITPFPATSPPCQFSTLGRLYPLLSPCIFLGCVARECYENKLNGSSENFSYLNGIHTLDEWFFCLSLNNSLSHSEPSPPLLTNIYWAPAKLQAPVWTQPHHLHSQQAIMQRTEMDLYTKRKEEEEEKEKKEEGEKERSLWKEEKKKRNPSLNLAISSDQTMILSLSLPHYMFITGTCLKDLLTP